MNPVDAEEDWRLTGQDEYLSGITLRRKPYKAPRPTWDHDHCEFCWAKFMEGDAPDILHEGYASPGDAHWVCPRCFDDFAERFQWPVAVMEE